MLNFGYWENKSVGPCEAQPALCEAVADMSEMGTAQRVLDIGSGFSEPATIWSKNNPHLSISCANVNKRQLVSASKFLKNHEGGHTRSIGLINSTATKLPVADKSVDRVIALESAQHFRPFSDFVLESKRVLKQGGILALTVPVVTEPARTLEFFKLGILSFTWSSEHYTPEDLRGVIESHGIKVASSKLIGDKVYPPLAEYYIKNRERLRTKILEAYPSYVEKILFRSLLKMREVSEDSIIDYLLLKAVAE